MRYLKVKEKWMLFTTKFLVASNRNNFWQTYKKGSLGSWQNCVEGHRAGSQVIFEEQQVKPHRTGRRGSPSTTTELAGAMLGPAAAATADSFLLSHCTGAFAWQRGSPALSPSCKAGWEKQQLTIPLPHGEVVFQLTDSDNWRFSK